MSNDVTIIRTSLANARALLGDALPPTRATVESTAIFAAPLRRKPGPKPGHRRATKLKSAPTAAEPVAAVASEPVTLPASVPVLAARRGPGRPRNGAAVAAA